MDATEPVVTIAVPRDLLGSALYCVRKQAGQNSRTFRAIYALIYAPVPANPELDIAMHGEGDAPTQRTPLYDKLVAPQGRKQVTILVPERGIDGKTIRHLVIEKELTQVFGWYLATHGVRGSADAGRTPVIAYAVAVADDLGVRDAVGIAGRAAALTGAPVTVTLDTGEMVKVDAMGQFV